MKKIFILGLILSWFVGSSVTKTWLGTSGTSFTVAANWFPSGVPGATDDVLFDIVSGSNNCTVPNGISISVISVSMVTGYTGTFNMGNANHFLTGDLIINSGILISTSGELLFGPNSNVSFALGALGTFSNNGGTVSLQVSANQSFVFSGNPTLNLLDLQTGTGSASSLRSVDFGSGLVVQNITFSSTRAYAFQGTVHIKVGLDLTGASTNIIPTGSTGTFIFDGSNADIIGTTVGRNYLPNVEINTAGNITLSSNISVQGNWTGTSGTFISGTSTVNIYGSSSLILGAASFDNLIIQTGGSVTFPANSETYIGKNFVVTGSGIFPTDNTLVFNGSTQGITGTFSPGRIRITSGATTINSGSALTLIDELTVNTGAIFNAGSNLLTLKADASSTARVANSDGAINGSVIVETYIPGGFTGWANLGVRGVSGQSVASWDTYASSGGANGIPMTCSLCTYGSNASGSWFNSIQTWNEPTTNYDSITVNSPLTPGKGFWVYVGNGSMTTTDLKLINKGTIVGGFQSLTATGQGTPYTSASSGNPIAYANLVANPYPSPVSASILMGVNTAGGDINDAIYAWNADANGFDEYVSGVGTGSGAFSQGIIPGGQGFYIESNKTFNVSFDFFESLKVSSNAYLEKQSAADIGKILRLKLKGVADENNTAFRIHPSATAIYDTKWDARKIFQTPGYVGYPGSYSKYTTISSQDAYAQDYAIQSIPLLTSSVSLPVLARVSATGSYTISAYDYKDLDPSVCITLHDKLNNTYNNLRMGDYSFTINDTTSTPRFELILCEDKSIDYTGVSETKGNSNAILISQDAQGAFVKTAFTQNTKAVISVYNIMGQKLINDINVEGTVTDTHLNLDMHNQVVFIRVMSDKENSTKKIVTH